MRKKADLRHRTPAATAPCCFNGAAPARARKYAHAKKIRADNDELQRGRARAGAEIIQTAVGVAACVKGFNGAAPARARK